MNSGTAAACTGWGWVCWLDAHPGLAGWIQAVGVVVALIGALIAAQIPHWNALRQARLDRRNRLFAAALVGCNTLFEFFSDESQRLDAVAETRGERYDLVSGRKALARIQAVFISATESVRYDRQAAKPIHFITECFAPLDELMSVDHMGVGAGAKQLAGHFADMARALDGVRRFLIDVDYTAGLTYDGWLERYPHFQFGVASEERAMADPQYGNR